MHLAKLRTLTNITETILAVKLKMINQDRMIFGDFSVNFGPIDRTRTILFKKEGIWVKALRSHQGDQIHNLYVWHP